MSPDQEKPLGRNAFYRHYREKSHLVDQIFGEAVRPLEAGAAAGRSDAGARLRRLFDHVAVHDRLFRALLGPRGDPSLAARLLGPGRTAACPEARIAQIGGELIRAVLGGMLTQTIVCWLNSESPLRSDELADRHLEMARALLGGTSVAGSPGRPAIGV